MFVDVVVRDSTDWVFWGGCELLFMVCLFGLFVDMVVLFLLIWLYGLLDVNAFIVRAGW